MVLGLERMRSGCATFGHPEREFPVFHVAGTNGKGSVSAMIERALRAAGKRTGLFTSPHLCRWNERVAIDSQPIDDGPFEAALERVLASGPPDFTFFETLTLAAFLAFRDAKVEALVLEVGLGGRLDATNVVPEPAVTAITSIARGLGGRYLEHEKLLGSTVAEIAAEKAAIFKPRVPAVVGPLDDAALQVARAAAKVVDAPLFEVVTAPITVPGTTALLLDHDGVLLPDGTRCELRPRLVGDHQRYNAAVAAGVLYAGRQALTISNAQIAEGVAKAEWPGRMELVRHQGSDVLLDGAHNVDGVRVLLEGVEALAIKGPKVLLFGALADKAFEPMLRLLGPHFDRCVYLAPEGRPAAPLAELSAIAPGEHAQSAAHALALATRDGAFVVAAGSIYMIGALRAELFGLQRDPVLGL